MSKTIHLLNKALSLHQPDEGFKTSIDAVLLAAACPARAQDSLLDMGCGVGSAGLCVLARMPDIRLMGIDIQEDHVALARINAAHNAMEENAAFLKASVCDYIYKEDGKNILFDHVICNPPYNDSGAHVRSPFPAKALAMGHYESASLQDWLDCANRNLKSGGSFTLIHKAGSIDKILQGLGARFGNIEIIPLWPKTGMAAKRVIIRAIKGRKSPAVLHAGLILHEENGAYTPAAENILRHRHVFL